MRLIQRIVISGITADMIFEGMSKTAGIAEACQFGNSCHGILSALHQREALTDAIFFQIACDRASCHFFKETAAYLAGQVNLVCQLLK